MQVDASDGHVMRFPCLVKHCIFILKRCDFLVSMRILPLLGRERRELNFLLSLAQLFLGIILSLRDDRSRRALIDLLLYLRPGLQSIPFQLNEHLLLHEVAVLIRHFIVLLLKDNMIIP